MRLSPNFILDELIKTKNPSFVGNNNPPPELLCTARVLAMALLQPIRDHYGKPLIPHSCYRSPELNKATPGSSPSSQHMKFEACDFHIEGVPLKGIFEWIWKESGLRFGQLILEGPSEDNPTWIHISLGEPYRTATQCQQVLTRLGSNYIYLDK